MTPSGNKRLLFVVNDASFFLSHRLPVALAARAHGYDVQIATPAGPGVDGIRAADLDWHSIRLSRSGRNPAREARTVADLCALYRRLRPALVHHVTPKPVLYGTAAARLTRVPAVVNAISGMGHVFADGSTRRAAGLRALVSAGYGAALRHPRMRVIFQNADARAEFLSRGWVRADEAVLVRGSGVDVTVFTPASSPPPHAPPLVVLTARLLFTKGVQEFVGAASLLRDAGVAARFALVGATDPDNPASVPSRTLAEWGERGIVELWGHRENMVDVFQAAQVACLPSYLEGLPKALIEAAACGLPIVTTDVPGCREVVRHGENGFLVPAREEAPLAEALRTLLADADLRARFGAASRLRAEREFSLAQVVASHLSLYDELVG